MLLSLIMHAYANLWSIRNYFPVTVRRDNCKLQRGANGRLIETGEEPMGKEWLQMRIDIHSIVFRILIVVQSS
jgi:hypothetical protein